MRTFLKPGVYSSKPKEFSADIISCACVVKFNEKILFLKKSPGKWSENLWGIPCGKADVNENINSTMARELKEEIGYETPSLGLQYLGKLFVVQNEGIRNLHHVFYYETKKIISVALSKEHVNYKWISKKEIFSVNLIPYQHEVLVKFKIFDNEQS